MANLHVFTGDEAADKVRAALRIPDGEFLVQHDVISCGPLRSYPTRREWIAERNAFWLAMARGDTFDYFPNDLIVEAERLAAAERITVWVGAGLSDRLLLPLLSHVAEIEGIELPPIEVAEITTHRSLPVPVLGWGMLRPSDVGRPAMRQPDLDAARETWQVVTSEDPMALLLHLDTVEDAADVNALSTLVERYPSSESGLSHWDESLLAAMPSRETTVFEVVGGAIGANHQHLDPVGDMYLFWRVRRMSEAREPLVTLKGDTRVLDENIRTCRVTPTALGLAVRDGDTNQAKVNGVDDWVGGVHLQAATGSPWYRRNGELIPGNAR